MKQKNNTSKIWKVILGVITAVVTSIAAIVGFIYGLQPTNIVTYDGEAPIGYQQPDLNVNPNEKNQNLKYYMVSVSNGLSSFIKLSKSKSAIIFDTGIGGIPTNWKNKQYQYNTTLVDCLKLAGVETIDAIFFTHFHTDHYSNLRNVIANFPIKRIIPNISYNKWNYEFGVD